MWFRTLVTAFCLIASLANAQTIISNVKTKPFEAQKWLNSLDPNGTFGSAQPSCLDLSNFAASCYTDTTNANNITAGTLPAARLPIPTILTLGGVKATARPANQFATGVNTGTGDFTFSRPSCADLSDSSSSCSVDATNASNITTGVLANTRGGAGSINDILQANGSGVVSAARIKAPGLSTVDRTIPDKAFQTISFEDLGAVGDGVIDDGTILDTAVAARFGTLPTTFNSVPVRLVGTPGKNYRIATTITVRQRNIQFDCNGARITSTASVTFDFPLVAATPSDMGGVSNCVATGTGTGSGASVVTNSSTQIFVRGVASNFFEGHHNFISNFGTAYDLCVVGPNLHDDLIFNSAQYGIVLRDCYLQPTTYTATGQAGNVLTLSSTTNIFKSSLVEGTNIPAGTIVSANPTATTITLSNTPTGPVTTFTVRIVGETQRAVVNRERIYWTGINAILLKAGVGHSLTDNDVEFTISANALVRMASSTKHIFTNTYTEARSPTTSAFQIDNELPLFGADRNSTDNTFIGGVITGPPLDFDIQSGTNTVIGPGVNFGARAIFNNGTNTIVLPGPVQLTTITGSGSTFRDLSGIFYGWTNLYPISGTTVPIRNKNGFVTFTGNSQVSATVTFPVNEDDAAYRVGVTCYRVAGIPAAGSMSPSTSFPRTNGFDVFIDNPVGTGVTTRCGYQLDR